MATSSPSKLDARNPDDLWERRLDAFKVERIYVVEPTAFELLGQLR